MNFTYKQIWLINYPVMMSILMEQLINITDAIFLGHYGEVELGASALAGMYYLILYMLGFGFSLGLQVMVARRNGEQIYDETGKVWKITNKIEKQYTVKLVKIVEGYEGSLSEVEVTVENKEGTYKKTHKVPVNGSTDIQVPAGTYTIT